MLRRLAFAIATLFLLGSAPALATTCSAAAGTCFWIGGTGTLDMSTDSAHWASSTGAGSCSCEPSGTASLTFDGASGGGTVTVNANFVTTGAFTMSAFTGTLDFSANNNSPTIGNMSNGGSGTRTLNLGSGTWTMTNGTNPWTQVGATNLTFSAASATLVFSGITAGSYRAISFHNAAGTGNSAYTIGTITINAATTGNGASFSTSAAFTVTNLNIGVPNQIGFSSGGAITVTNAVTITGASPGTVLLYANNPNANQATITSANNWTVSWAGIRGLVFTGGGSLTATNSVDYGNNGAGISITPPSFSGGGGGIIGG